MARVVSYQTQSPLNPGFPRLETIRRTAGRGFFGYSTHYELYSSDVQFRTAYRAFMHQESVMNTNTSDSPSVSGICARVNQRVERAVAERGEKASTTDKSRDQDR